MQSSLPFSRPFLMQELRKLVFNDLHNLSYLGLSASMKIRSRNYWPKMRKSIKHGAKNVNIAKNQKYKE